MMDDQDMEIDTGPGAERFAWHPRDVILRIRSDQCACVADAQWEEDVDYDMCWWCPPRGWEFDDHHVFNRKSLLRYLIKNMANGFFDVFEFTEDTDLVQRARLAECRPDCDNLLDKGIGYRNMRA